MNPPSKSSRFGLSVNMCFDIYVTPADKTVWYELSAQAVEMKTAVVGIGVPATAVWLSLFSCEAKLEYHRK